MFLKDVIRNNNISHVFHAAAYKHVNLLESNISYAVKNNILGTLSVLEALSQRVKSFVLISTDKAANPVNILGSLKRFLKLFLFITNKKN